MVWKSERWKSKLSLVECEEGLANPTAPQLLEISYVRRGADDGHEEGEEALEHEVVYEDAGSARGAPRLLVSLTAVSALKELCEHEHAKYEKVVDTLTHCRASYYKELRWLREQLYLAYQTDEEAMVKKANLTPDDFEVYWFEPPHYIDPETAEFLRTCIRATSQKLINENTTLRTQAAKQNLLESGIVRTVLRQLRKDYSVGEIVREYHAQLRTKTELGEFEEVAKELLGIVDGTPPPEPAGEPLPDPALQEELEALREKVRESHATISELRAQLAQDIDARTERARAAAERADAERERADMVQQRAERLERQYGDLRRELRRSEDESAQRLCRSVTRLGEALQCLSPAGSSLCTPSMSPAGKLQVTSPKNVDMHDALNHLDLVASGIEGIAQEVLAELLELRAKVAAFEESRGAVPPSPPPLPPVASPPAPRTPSPLRPSSGSAALKARLAALEKEAADKQALLERERGERESLRRDLGGAQSTIDQLQIQLARWQGKVDKLRAKLRKLRADCGSGDVDSDDDDGDGDDEMFDFMVPYTKRAAASLGKRRWEILSEDAACAQKKRAYLGAHGKGLAARMLSPKPGLPPQEEVTAAFHFINFHNSAVATLKRPVVAATPRRGHSKGSDYNGEGSRRVSSSPMPRQPSEEGPHRRSLSSSSSQPAAAGGLLATGALLEAARSQTGPSAGPACVRGTVAAEGGMLVSTLRPEELAEATAEERREASPSVAVVLAPAAAAPFAHSADLRAGPRPPSVTRNASAPAVSDLLAATLLGAPHGGGCLRPVKALRSTAQASIISPSRRSLLCEAGQRPVCAPSPAPKLPSRQLPIESPARLKSSTLKGRGVRDQHSVGWTGHGTRTCMPLTNMGRSLGHSESAPEGVVSAELLPALPPGRVFRGSAAQAWRVPCCD